MAKEDSIIALDDWQKLRRKVERLATEAAKAQGALDEVKRRIREDYGTRTVEEAEAKLAGFEEEERALHDRWVRAVEKFQRKWAEVLEEKVE